MGKTERLEESQFKDAMKAFTQAVGDLAKAVTSEVSDAGPEVVQSFAGVMRQAASKLDTFGSANAAGRTAASERAQQTRAQLLQAAAKVFAAKGFEGASMDDVAKAAGFTKGALYAHFSSKFELIVALAGRVLAADQPLPGPGQLPELLGQASGQAAGEDLALTIEIMALALRDDRFRERILPDLDRSTTQVARQVAANRGAPLDELGLPAVTPEDVEAAIGLTGLVAAARTAELVAPNWTAGPLAGRLAARLLSEPPAPDKPSKKRR